MLILFPPSEGKSAALGGAPVELGELSFPALTGAREAVVDELVRVSRGEGAAEQLKVGKSLLAEVQRNTRLWGEPAQAAAKVYSGVLYEAFDYEGLDVASRVRAESSTVIISAVWGAVRLRDCIPAYRLSMGTKLGEIGDLAKFWKGELGEALDEYAGEQLVVDGRSSAYLRAWSPSPARHLLVRVERVASGGTRQVVSHMAKHYRGLLGRYLVEHNLTGVEEPGELAVALGQDFEVELSSPTEKKPGTLTLVVRA
ncbi:YaaA family protein [Rothia nasisuis]|uniref:YaaA family protein n=1 Tax=Rothia nasisuis TaxID=2109647 RepID=UPI001F3C7D26|nr:peroxide stress protein YaaA [Rothia nasisuis]